MAAALEPVLGRRPGLRRIYVDLPGHGESPAGPATSEHVLATVSAFMQTHLGGAPALLAGWSYGGYIAGALSRRQPAAVAGLLLICAGVRDHDRDLPGPPAGPAPEHWIDGVPADLRAHLATAIGHRTAQTAARVATVLAGSLPGDRAYQQQIRGDGFGLADEVAAYPGPACVITGRQDRVVGYADQFRCLDAYPSATFAVLASAGHYLPIERPAEFGSLVEAWLDRCAASS